MQKLVGLMKQENIILTQLYLRIHLNIQLKGKKFGQEMKYGQAGSLITHAEMSPDNYVLMQSTGLKNCEDINGAKCESWEGDI